MKNNQFKKVIRQEIENKCKLFNYMCICVDETNNSRMIYIYTEDWVCVGIFDCYLSNEHVLLSFTTDTETPHIACKKERITCRYSHFNEVVQLIDKSFGMVDKEKIDEN